MISISGIKKIAHKLVLLSIDEETGRVSPEYTSRIITLIEMGELEKIGIKVSRTQTITLLKSYVRLLKNVEVEDTLTITTAIKVTHNDLSKDNLYKIYNKSHTRYIVDTSIIGGIKIQSGWDVIDDTIQHTLDTLKQ